MDDVVVIDEERRRELNKTAIRHLVQKLDLRLIPFLFILEMGSYINRTNIGHAKLMGINSDLNLSTSESEWAVSIFFLAYMIFEIPSMAFMRYLSPTVYLPLSMLSWGTVAVGMAFVKNAPGLLAARFLLGVTQAGFFPSIVIYISFWYRKRDQTMRIAILFGAAIIGGAFGSILAFGFAYMNNVSNLKSWQWMFLLEGVPMILLGIITFLFLRDLPNAVQWLDNTEKQLLTNILQNDTCVHDYQDTRLSRKQVLDVFLDGRIYLYALIGIGDLGVIKYLTTYLPSLVQAMNISDAQAHLMTALPYVLAFLFCLLIGYSSTRRNEHSYHLSACLSLGLVGFILLISLTNQGEVALYISSCITCCGVFAALPMLLSWLTNNVDGLTKKSVAIGFTMGVGQLGGIIFPFVTNNGLTFRLNYFICLGVLAVSLILTIILRANLKRENRRREHLSSDDYALQANIDEPCDWHPDVRYVL